MTLHQLDEYFRRFLNMEHYRGDPSLNGIQVENRQPEEKEIRKVAFAVDACHQPSRRRRGRPAVRPSWFFLGPVPDHYWSPLPADPPVAGE